MEGGKERGEKGVSEQASERAEEKMYFVLTTPPRPFTAAGLVGTTIAAAVIYTSDVKNRDVCAVSIKEEK